MTDPIPLPFDLPSVRRKKLTADFEGGDQSSDGGLLLLREAERKLGMCGRLAEAMPDHRDTDRVRHAMFEMVMARVCAIACGHEDAIDLDRLRHDPLMKVAVGRCHALLLPDVLEPVFCHCALAPHNCCRLRPLLCLCCRGWQRTYRQHGFASNDSLPFKWIIRRNRL
jgi:Transposase DDE domain group 1